MEQITLRIQPNTLASLDEEAGEHDKSRSEHIRDILQSRNEHGDAEELRARIDDLETERDRLADRVEELEAEVESLDARNTDLTNQLAEANSRIDAANDLVEYVDDERNAQQRWREAGLLGKAKYTVFGMPTDEKGGGGE